MDQNLCTLKRGMILSKTAKWKICDDEKCGIELINNDYLFRFSYNLAPLETVGVI